MIYKIKLMIKLKNIKKVFNKLLVILKIEIQDASE